MSEKIVQNKALLLLSRGLTRLFRNNVAVAWAGDEIIRKGPDVYIRGARPVRSGLCVGSSDTIGWTSLTIMPHMVGREVAVFTAIEFKSEHGRTTMQQENFLSVVREAGGIAGVARTVEEAQELVERGLG